MTLKELALKYEISQKVLKSDMKEINQFLRTIPAQEIEISDNGQIVLGEDFKSFQIQQYLYEMDTYMYKFSPDERQIYIMMKLVIEMCIRDRSKIVVTPPQAAARVPAM